MAADKSAQLAELMAAVEDAIARHYQDGFGIRELAVAYGRSYGTIRRLLVKHDVALRSRGGSRPKP